MAGAVTLFLAITLSGLPATIACVRSCGAEPRQTTAAGSCHDHASTAPGKSRITSGAEECDTTPSVTPFLVETTLRPLSVMTAQPAVITRITSQTTADLASQGVFINGRGTGPPVIELRSTILRI
jgi:hypothetical protein